MVLVRSLIACSHGTEASRAAVGIISESKGEHADMRGYGEDAVRMLPAGARNQVAERGAKVGAL